MSSNSSDHRSHNIQAQVRLVDVFDGVHVRLQAFGRVDRAASLLQVPQSSQKHSRREHRACAINQSSRVRTSCGGSLPAYGLAIGSGGRWGRRGGAVGAPSIAQSKQCRTSFQPLDLPPPPPPGRWFQLGEYDRASARGIVKTIDRLCKRLIDFEAVNFSQKWITCIREGDSWTMNPARLYMKTIDWWKFADCEDINRLLKHRIRHN